MFSSGLHDTQKLPEKFSPSSYILAGGVDFPARLLQRVGAKNCFLFIYFNFTYLMCIVSQRLNTLFRWWLSVDGSSGYVHVRETEACASEEGTSFKHCRLKWRRLVERERGGG